MDGHELKARILEICTQSNTRIRQKDLPALMGDIPGSDIQAALDELIREGQLARSNKGRLVSPDVLGLTLARVQATASGYMFITTGGPREKDALLTQDDTGCALNGDLVLARVKKQSDGRFTATVENVLMHANGRIVGTFRIDDGVCVISPNDKRVHASFTVRAGNDKGAKEGELVVADVTKWSDQGDHEAKVEQVLGDQHDHEARLRAIIYDHGLSDVFPDETLEAARKVPPSVRDQDRKGREDLTKQPCVTIDGATAKDFDDAVYAERISGGWRLYVHIADVSYYVREHTPLEHEAFERGTSVYLLDKVLPMLPEELSNGICSLNQGVDRLAFSCIMDIDGGSGDVADYRLARTVIRSGGRLIYDDVTALLEGDGAVREKLAGHEKMLRELHELTEILSARRARRGSIDFDLPEADIRLDEIGKPISVEVAPRGIANRMIEECMLLANETVAQYALNLELPFVYRVHEEPDAERIEAFAALSTNLGYTLRIGKQGVHPKHLRALLDQLKGKPEEAMLSNLMLRSLQRARYDTRGLGHFGLSLRDYCHFTSPIRRYPDLFIHRVLGMQLAGELGVEEIARLAAAAQEAAVHASERERASSEAEMAVDDWKKAEYMLEHVGESFQGVIAGISNFGIFVNLPNTVSGLIPIRTLEDDHYLYDEATHKLTGRKTKRVFRLGDPIGVLCASVDIEQWKIEFSLEDM